MLALLVVNTLVTINSIEMAFVPHPPQILSPKPQQVLAATPTIPTPQPKADRPLAETSTPLPYKEYTTKSGDTIRQIAKEQYGSELYWTTIWNDNTDLTDPAVIHPGLKLRIRTSKQIQPEELVRVLPTETPQPKADQGTPQEALSASVTPSPSNTSTGEQTGTPVGNFASVYMEAGSKYGIPWQILYGMHKVESGLRDGPVDSGAGPQGPLQFLPATWASYGVDGNGDGNIDINSAPDAIHAAANYLAKHGSIEAGLNSYGHVKDDVYAIARSLGYNP